MDDKNYSTIPTFANELGRVDNNHFLVFLTYVVVRLMFRSSKQKEVFSRFAFHIVTPLGSALFDHLMLSYIYIGMNRERDQIYPDEQMYNNNPPRPVTLVLSFLTLKTQNPRLYSVRQTSCGHTSISINYRSKICLLTTNNFTLLGGFVLFSKL